MRKVPKIRSLQSLQYLREKMEDDADFLHADKGESFLQIDNVTLGVRSQSCPNYP